MDISVRVTRDKDGRIGVTQLHPEGPIEDFFDEYQIDSKTILLVINALAAYQYGIEVQVESMQEQEKARHIQAEEFQQYRDKIIADLPKAQGIYALRCTQNEKVYVGASKNIRARVKSHCYDMTRNHNHPLRTDVSEFGMQSITAEVLEIVESATNLSAREQHWIAQLDSKENGYNSSNSYTHHSWAEGDE